MLFGLDIKIFIVCGLLGLLLYFILSKTLFNSTRIGWRGKRFSVLATFFALPILFYLAIVAVLLFKLFVPEFQKDFDQAAWAGIKDLRYEMKDDILESKMLENKTPTEVLQLLGEPSSKITDDIWIYDLGVSKAGFGWQFNDLKIYFQNNQVENIELIETID